MRAVAIATAPAPPGSRPQGPTPRAAPRRNGYARTRLDVQFDHVGVVEFLVALDRLPVVHPRAPDAGELQSLLEVPVDLPGEVEDRPADRDRERAAPVGRLT